MRDIITMKYRTTQVPDTLQYTTAVIGKSEVYLGLGPSAHSFNGKTRKWNISNNTAYIKSVNKGVIPFESEMLTEADRYNEFVMTGLRTAIGINRKLWDELMPVMYKADLLTEMNELISQKFLVHDGSRIFIPFQHWYKADQLISKLFATENR